MKKLLSVFLSLLLAAGLASAALSEGEAITIGVVYKQSGNPFFQAAVRGFEEAAEELGFTLLHNGPADSSNEGQIQIIEGYIAQGVDGIAISANDRDGIVPVLQKAMDAGIVVMSWDSSAAPEGRQLDLAASVAENIGVVQVQEIARQIGYEGQIAIVSAGATMDNQNTWIGFMKKELEKEEYAKMELVDVVYGDDLPDKSYQEMEGLIKTYPDLKGVISPTTVGVAAVANCITDNGLIGQIKVTGLGLPSEMAQWIENGSCEAMFLWNPIDLGYCAAYATVALITGAMEGAIGDTFDVGRLGEYTVGDDGEGNPFSIVGDPFCFNADNIGFWKEMY